MEVYLSWQYHKGKKRESSRIFAIMDSMDSMDSGVRCGSRI